MAVKAKVRKGEYFDSVTLMRASRQLLAGEGIQDAAVVMGSPENKAILQASGLLCPELAEAGDTDLLLAVSADSEAHAEAGLARAFEVLASLKKRNSHGATFRPCSLEGALEVLPGANLALISVAGRHAGDLARSALEKGLHVMLFSDNVPLETEIELKRLAAAKELLLMGPDCGTAILNGIPLGFANAVPRGKIGIVAAAGTGLQEVSSLVANEGGGVSQAIGTGGRDLKAEVGGITFLQGIRALLADPDTSVLLLVSKPPHPEVLQRILEALAEAKIPVVACLLGAAPQLLEGSPALHAQTLEDAALLATALARGADPEAATREVQDRRKRRDEDLEALARTQRARISPGRRYLRGLFSGGTFCYEAQLLLKGIGEVHANAPAFGSTRMESALRSVGHTVVDLGEDEFTVGRPHPMVDFSLRVRRILEEGRDPETALILLDVVLGFGAHPDPASELVPALTSLQGVSVLCSVTGTDRDPQGRRRTIQALEEAGAVVLASNAEACRLARRILDALGT